MGGTQHAQTIQSWKSSHSPFINLSLAEVWVCTLLELQVVDGQGLQSWFQPFLPDLHNMMEPHAEECEYTTLNFCDLSQTWGRKSSSITLYHIEIFQYSWKFYLKRLCSLLHKEYLKQGPKSEITQAVFCNKSVSKRQIFT